ncbi:MAG: hypothetical protein ACM31C_28080 [Acidobacteriota bacterium]
MFHVFVEGPKDGTPEGVDRLAEAIGSHYGLPARDLRARIASGRFRVKGNVDRATAEKYARDLDILGARTTIEEANAGNSRPTPLPFPAVRPATPLPFAAVSPPKEPPQRPSGQYASGLAAAFSAEPPPSASLGALEKGDVAFALAPVDGSEEAGAPPPSAFAPPGEMMPASIGPPPDEPKATVKFADKKSDKQPAAKPEKKPRPKDEPVDLFVPPELAEGGGFSVELAPEDEARSARKKASTPPASVPVVAAPAEERPARASTQPAMRRSQPSIPVQSAPAEAPAARAGLPLGDPRVRLVAGVVLAILIGFLPAHLVAAMREKSAFDTIDRKVLAEQEQATTPDAYAALDQFRDEQLARKKDERRSIAIVALVMWGAIGGAVAYGWFRRIPWERFEQA